MNHNSNNNNNNNINSVNGNPISSQQQLAVSGNLTGENTDICFSSVNSEYIDIGTNNNPAASALSSAASYVFVPENFNSNSSIISNPCREDSSSVSSNPLDILATAADTMSPMNTDVKDEILQDDNDSSSLSVEEIPAAVIVVAAALAVSAGLRERKWRETETDSGGGNQEEEEEEDVVMRAAPPPERIVERMDRLVNDDDDDTRKLGVIGTNDPVSNVNEHDDGASASVDDMDDPMVVSSPPYVPNMEQLHQSFNYYHENPQIMQPPPFVYIMRHGERIDDVDQSWNGPRRSDPPLTATGIDKALDRGTSMRDRGITRIYSSPFLRTLQTSIAVAKGLGISIISVDAGLSEVFNERCLKTTTPELLSSAEIASMLSEFQFDLSHYEHSPKPTFGESYEDAHARYFGTVKRIAALHRYETILLVTHGESLGAITQEWDAPGTLAYNVEYLAFLRLEAANPQATSFRIVERSGVDVMCM